MLKIRFAFIVEKVLEVKVVQFLSSGVKRGLFFELEMACLRVSSMIFCGFEISWVSHLMMPFKWSSFLC